MKTIVAGLMIFTMALVAEARIIPKVWSYQELYDDADLVVIAKPISTQETDERTTLPGISPATDVIGLSTEFSIDLVMKGEKSLKKSTLHHYKLAPLPPNVLIANGPNLASFDSKSNTRYFLFLHRESDGRFAPVSGQVDPTLFSVLKIESGLVR